MTKFCQMVTSPMAVAAIPKMTVQNVSPDTDEGLVRDRLEASAGLENDDMRLVPSQRLMACN
jgi:hypothetical protein